MSDFTFLSSFESILSVCSFQNVGNYILCFMFNNFFIKGLMTRPPCEPLQVKVQKRPTGHLLNKFQVSANWPLASGPPKFLLKN